MAWFVDPMKSMKLWKPYHHNLHISSHAVTTGEYWKHSKTYGNYGNFKNIQKLSNHLYHLIHLNHSYILWSADPNFPKASMHFWYLLILLCVKFLCVIDVIGYLMGIICIMEIKGLPLHPNQPNTSHISHILFFCPHHESCNGQRPGTSDLWMANGKICQGCEWLDKHQQTKIFLQFTMISTIIYDIYIIYNIYNSLTWIKII